MLAQKTIDTIDDFIRYLKSRNRSPHTIIAYQKDISDFFLFCQKNNDKKFTEITHLDIRQYSKYLTKENQFDDNTILRKNIALKTFFKYLYQQGEVTKNPCLHLPIRRKQQSLPEILSQVQILELLDKITIQNALDFRNKVIFEMLYGLGLRIAELQQLSIEKIDLSTEQIKVLGKRNKVRILPLTPRLVNLLKQFLSLRKEFLLELNQDHPQLLFNQRGTAITIRGIRFVFMTTLKKLQLELGKVANTVDSPVLDLMNLYPHLLRHSIATHLLENNADIKMVQDFLGHASLTATQVYTHLSKNKLKEKYTQFHPLAAN